MKLSQSQIESIRRLVNAARDESTSYERECDEVYYKGEDEGERCECDGLVSIDHVPDLDVLRAAALAVELDVLDKLPTLPSEIEVEG